MGEMADMIINGEMSEDGEYLGEIPDFEKMTSPGKSYWVVDSRSKSYDLREEIKTWGGYWVPEHKSWCIEDPDETAKRVLTQAGLKLQFRGLI